MSEPIRVLHILQRMEAGGTQALLMNIYRNINREKVQFDFLVEYPNRQFYDDEIESMGGKIYRTSVREDLNIFKFCRYLNKFFKEHREYKIVHVHAYSIGFFCLRAAKRNDIPTRIAHSHSNGMTNDNKKYIKLLMQKLYPMYATDYFACSEEAGKYLFRKRQFHILPNAIDSAKFVSDANIRKDIRQELGVSNHFVIGHVGRFRPEKNHKFLINVFAEIKKLKGNATLILVGTGESENEIKKQIQTKELENDVIFLNNRKDMYRIYQAMDVFIFPSLYEGLGIVAVEAQAAGIPIICSEGLPPETEITPLYKRIPLSYGAEKWANEAINAAKNPAHHTNMQKYVIDAGFDMSATADKIEEFYLHKHNDL